MKVSFSQHRRRPNPKVWNMDCGVAVYHDVCYLFGSGRYRSINLAFQLVAEADFGWLTRGPQGDHPVPIPEGCFSHHHKKQMVTVSKKKNKW
jgi:hypothetical protein